MKVRIGKVGLALIAVSLLATDTKADNKTVRKELEAAYARITRATQAKDITTMTRYMAADYQEIGLTGNITTRKEAIATQKQMLIDAQSQSAQFRISQLVLRGNTAVVTVRYIFSVVTKATPDTENKSHKIVANAPMRHTWTKTGSGWQLKKVEELKGATLTVDGKPQPIQRSP